MEQLFLVQVIERKGLDMVRRDWSLLSKELGDFCLAQILSGGYVILLPALTSPLPTHPLFSSHLTSYLPGNQEN